MSVTQNWTRQAARHENSDDYSRPITTVETGNILNLQEENGRE